MMNFRWTKVSKEDLSIEAKCCVIQLPVAASSITEIEIDNFMHDIKVVYDLNLLQERYQLVHRRVIHAE